MNRGASPVRIQSAGLLFDLFKNGFVLFLDDQIDDGKRCFHLMHPLIHVGYPIFQLGLHIMYFAVVEPAQLHMFFIEL